jgi:voltage-gated potassium channel
MVNPIKHQEIHSFATRGLIILAIIMLAFAFASTYIISDITHQSLASGYYTVEALFDAVGIDANVLFGSSVPLFSNSFYEIFAVSVVDGIAKILVVGFAVAAIVNMISTADIRSRVLGASVRHMKGHVIMCGYSTLAEHLIPELKGNRLQFVVVEKERMKVDMLREEGTPVLHDDFTKDDALERASVRTAKAVLFLTGSDYMNLLGAVTARHLSPKVMIITRASDLNTITKIRRAGADITVIPETLAGLEIGNAIGTSR